ncbi:MAG: peptidoglycan editing factor PgeF [Mycobacteriales bacterium]
MTSTSLTSSSSRGRAEPPVAGIELRFTDRRGGVSRPPYDTLNLALHVGDEPGAVARNRALAATGPIAWMQQVHGGTVALVDGPDAAPAPRCDGLVTDRPGLWLAVMVADCVPVLLADPVARVVAAAHAGRRGLTAQIVPATLAAMVRLGAQPERITARLGPSICPRCYQLPAAVVEEVTSLVPGAICRTADGQAGLDVAAGVRAQLLAAGVPQSAVASAERCSAEDPELFSYRRDRVTGRFAGLIRMLDS